MIRKVYEVDPMLSPECGGGMRIMAFLTDYAVVDRIIGQPSKKTKSLLLTDTRPSP
jgi:hypothetical protein